jgi:hypothetical protein
MVHDCYIVGTAIPESLFGGQTGNAGPVLARTRRFDHSQRATGRRAPTKISDGHGTVM